MADDRLKALDTALLNIEKQYGKGSVMRLGDDTRAPLEVIPTGSIALDVALGVGGLPRGRVVEIYGPESSGKTTVALHAVASERPPRGRERPHGRGNGRVRPDDQRRRDLDHAVDNSGDSVGLVADWVAVERRG